MGEHMEIPGVEFVDCDGSLKRRVGQVMGEVTKRHLHLDDGFAIVALHDDQPVGVISVYPRALPAPLSGTCEGYVDIIEVASAYRRRGIARRLVEMSMERARAQGLCQLRAWSSEDKTEAIPMWKALGFGLCPATTCPGGQQVRGYFVTHRL
jgi:GNAT superfamily N-acetyltransferase